MKTILIGALVLSLFSGAAASAKDGRGNGNGRDRGDRYERSHDRDAWRGDRGDRREYRGDRREDRGPRYSEPRRHDNRAAGHRWQRGERLPQAYRGYGVDYRGSHLRRPPSGYRWVRIGDDYVLTSVGTGLIVEVISGGF